MPKDSQIYELLKKMYVKLPYCQALKLAIEEDVDGKPVMSLPWQQELVGEQQHHGILHKGAVMTLVDVVGAVAVTAYLTEPEFISTLDLRIDYMRDPEPQQRIFARSECRGLRDNQIAYVRIYCYEKGQENNPFAQATATYIRSAISQNSLDKLYEFCR